MAALSAQCVNLALTVPQPQLEILPLTQLLFLLLLACNILQHIYLVQFTKI